MGMYVMKLVKMYLKSGHFITCKRVNSLGFGVFLKFIYLFTFGFIGSSLGCADFSLQWLLLLRSTGSRLEGFSSCGSRALEHRLSCSTQA